jgi:branched-chain amino acid transport system substrate-binding protein
MRTRRIAALALGAALLALPIGGAAAPEPLEINVMIPLTGFGGFIGHAEQESIRAIEADVNKHGGIDGRPLKFVVYDDQTNPQQAIQLLAQITAKKVPVVLGGALVPVCRAMMPLVTNGPVLFCFSPGVHPDPGSYTFSSSISTNDLIKANFRYWRERGIKRVATITSTDASGQDADRALDAALTLPENKSSFQVVAREHFNPTDISVSAQIAHIKASNAQVLIAWTTGTPVGTVFRGVTEGGLDIPVVTTNGNLNYATMKQYGGFLPKQLYFPGAPVVGPSVVTDRATKAALADYDGGLQALGDKPDFTPSTDWDPLLLVVSAYKKLGANATAAQMRDYLAKLTGFVGVNGRYDFPKYPQRGLGEEATIMVRWDPAKETWVAVSRPGGTPIGAR